jgi:hypothetical protein
MDTTATTNTGNISHGSKAVGGLSALELASLLHQLFGDVVKCYQGKCVHKTPAAPSEG